MLTYVYKNYRNPDLTADSISRAFGYSKRTLTDIFSESVGNSVKRYIDSLGIDCLGDRHQGDIFFLTAALFSCLRDSLTQPKDPFADLFFLFGRNPAIHLSDYRDQPLPR